MDTNLTLNRLLERANELFPHKEIVTWLDDGSIHRYTYEDAYDRICQLGHALDNLGVERGERIATLSRNQYRHLELYFAGPCTGRSTHIVNVRLPEDQLVYTINDAEDRILFFEPEFLDIVERTAPILDTVEEYVVLDDTVPETSLDSVHAYEELVAGHSREYDWPTLDENRECTLCYTSGTTGRPKGVPYSHRGLYLHSLTLGHVDTYGVGERETILLNVPMYHTNGWGLPYGATFVGAKQVLPGSHTDPEEITSLIADENVRIAAGAVTVWVDIENFLDEHPKADLTSLDRILAGAGKVPRSLLPKFEKYGVEVTTGWGMTETVALGTTSTPTSQVEELSREERTNQLSKAGLPAPGVQARIRDDAGAKIPRDGESKGELEIKGPWIVDEYLNRPSANVESFTEDGFLKTGDVATWDEYGYIDIVDRLKNVIKSGGEWISTLDLENELMAHEKVKEAAVIAIPDETWQERPLACIVAVGDEEPAITELEEHVRQAFPAFWVPDHFVFLEELPRKGTDKFDKTKLRDILLDRNLDVVLKFE